MARYSDFYRYRGRLFRYNYDDALVEWISIEDDGTIFIVDAVGLGRDNWTDEDARSEYLFEWCMDIDDEMEYLMDDFIAEFCG